MKNKNIILYYLIQFFVSLSFIMPIWAFFFTIEIGFSFSTAVIIILTSLLVSFFIEIPSGAWADRFGRKKMYILGGLLMILSLLLWLTSKNIYIFIIAAIIDGIGFAIMSGNIEALIHDYLEEKGEEKKYKDIQANGYIYYFIGRSGAAFLAGFLYTMNPYLPVYLTVLSLLIVVILTALLTTPKQVLSEHKDNIKHIKSTIKNIFKNKIILFFILILSIEGWLGNLYWYTYQPYFKQLGFTITNIGVIFGSIALLSSFGSYIIKKLQDKIQTKYIIIIIISILFFISLLIFSFNIYIGLIGILIYAVQCGFIFPFANNYLIGKFSKSQKSTILSIFSSTFTIGIVILTISAGFIVDYFGLEKLYFINIILISILFMFTLLFIKKKGNLL